MRQCDGGACMEKPEVKTCVWKVQVWVCDWMLLCADLGKLASTFARAQKREHTDHKEIRWCFSRTQTILTASTFALSLLYLYGLLLPDNFVQEIYSLEEQWFSWLINASCTDSASYFAKALLALFSTWKLLSWHRCMCPFCADVHPFSVLQLQNFQIR